MKDRFHGVFSISLFGAAIAVAWLLVLRHSAGMALIYLALILLAGLTMLYAYCSKCELRLQGCRHVFVGGLTRFLPEREDTPYTSMDYWGVTVAMIVLLAFPQYWLWQVPWVLAVFSALLVFAGLHIVLFVCKGCGNRKCSMCVMRNKGLIR